MRNDHASWDCNFYLLGLFNLDYFIPPASQAIRLANRIEFAKIGHSSLQAWSINIRFPGSGAEGKNMRDTNGFAVVSYQILDEKMSFAITEILHYSSRLLIPIFPDFRSNWFDAQFPQRRVGAG